MNMQSFRVVPDVGAPPRSAAHAALVGGAEKAWLGAIQPSDSVA